MTTHKHNESRSEDASNASRDTTIDERTASIIEIACDADGMPYELSTHYLFYGPTLPNPAVQAYHRAGSRDSFRERIILDLSSVAWVPDNINRLI